MRWRLRAAIVAIFFGSGMAGCDCIGCSSEEVARAEGKGWSVALACEANTHLGGVGAPHVGGILYPDGCTNGWQAHAEGHTMRVKAKLNGPTTSDPSCSEVRAFCKKAKGTVVTRVEGADIVAAASTGEQAVGFYILTPDSPFEWSGAAASSADAKVLLAAMPPAEQLITQMLTEVVPLERRMLPALEGPRLERHFAELRGAIVRCAVDKATLERVGKTKPEIASDAYDSAFPKDPQVSCADANAWLRAAAPPAVAPRVVADLRACDGKCGPLRFENLAVLADALGSKEAATVLARNLGAPSPVAWKADEDEARSTYISWHAGAYTVAHVDPAAARGPLLAQIAATSTRGLAAAHADEDEEDDEDAGTDAAPRPRKIVDAGADAAASTAEGVSTGDLPLERPTTGIITGGSLATTLRDLAELLLLADDPSVHDAMLALARDAKRDRGVRQIAIAYLAATNDARAPALLADTILTAEQREKLTPKSAPAESPAGSASTTTTTTRSRGRRHHHH